MRYVKKVFGLILIIAILCMNFTGVYADSIYNKINSYKMIEDVNFYRILGIFLSNFIDPFDTAVYSKYLDKVIKNKERSDRPGLIKFLQLVLLGKDKQNEAILNRYLSVLSKFQNNVFYKPIKCKERGQLKPATLGDFFSKVNDYFLGDNDKAIIYSTKHYFDVVILRSIIYLSGYVATYTKDTEKKDRIGKFLNGTFDNLALFADFYGNIVVKDGDNYYMVIPAGLNRYLHKDKKFNLLNYLTFYSINNAGNDNNIKYINNPYPCPFEWFDKLGEFDKLKESDKKDIESIFGKATMYFYLSSLEAEGAYIFRSTANLDGNLINTSLSFNSKAMGFGFNLFIDKNYFPQNIKIKELKKILEEGDLNTIFNKRLNENLNWNKYMIDTLTFTGFNLNVTLSYAEKIAKKIDILNNLIKNNNIKGNGVQFFNDIKLLNVGDNNANGKVINVANKIVPVLLYNVEGKSSIFTQVKDINENAEKIREINNKLASILSVDDMEIAKITDNFGNISYKRSVIKNPIVISFKGFIISTYINKELTNLQKIIIGNQRDAEILNILLLPSYLSYFEVSSSGDSSNNALNMNIFNSFKNSEELIKDIIQVVEENISIQSEEKSPEELQKEVLQNAAMFLSPDKYVEYKGNVISKSFIGWLASIYDSIVKDKSGGFLDTPNFANNFLVKPIMNLLVVFIIPVALAIGVILAIVIGIIKRRKVLWVIRAIAIVVIVAFSFPILLDTTVAIIDSIKNNSIKVMTKDLLVKAMIEDKNSWDNVYDDLLNDSVARDILWYFPYIWDNAIALRNADKCKIVPDTFKKFSKLFENLDQFFINFIKVSLSRQYYYNGYYYYHIRSIFDLLRFLSVQYFNDSGGAVVATNSNVVISDVNDFYKFDIPFRNKKELIDLADKVYDIISMYNAYDSATFSNIEDDFIKNNWHKVISYEMLTESVLPYMFIKLYDSILNKYGNNIRANDALDALVGDFLIVDGKTIQKNIFYDDKGNLVDTLELKKLFRDVIPDLVNIQRNMDKALGDTVILNGILEGSKQSYLFKSGWASSMYDRYHNDILVLDKSNNYLNVSKPSLEIEFKAYRFYELLNKDLSILSKYQDIFESSKDGYTPSNIVGIAAILATINFNKVFGGYLIKDIYPNNLEVLNVSVDSYLRMMFAQSTGDISLYDLKNNKNLIMYLYQSGGAGFFSILIIIFVVFLYQVLIPLFFTIIFGIMFYILVYDVIKSFIIRKSFKYVAWDYVKANILSIIIVCLFYYVISLIYVNSDKLTLVSQLMLLLIFGIIEMSVLYIIIKNNYFNKIKVIFSEIKDIPVTLVSNINKFVEEVFDNRREVLGVGGNFAGKSNSNIEIKYEKVSKSEHENSNDRKSEFRASKFSSNKKDESKNEELLQEISREIDKGLKIISDKSEQNIFYQKFSKKTPS